MRRLASILLLAWLAGPAVAQLPVEAHPNQSELLKSADPELTAHKRLAFDFWREVVQAHHVDRASAYVAETFIEHAAGAESGRDAIVAAVGRQPPAQVKPTIDELVSIVAERELVVLAFRRELPDLEHEGQTYTTTAFDMLRVKDGKIVEHWSSGPDD
jgi:predicted SnoaL-like aldol condensation-catalyzing enzyme